MSKKCKQGCHFNRRDFLKIAGGTASGALFLNVSPNIVYAKTSSSDNLHVVDGYNPEVISAWIPINESESCYDLFKEVVERSSDFTWLSPGDTVFLKLSINSGNKYPATTDPWALKCMIQLLNEKGAGEIIVGDQSGVEHVLWTDKIKRGSSRKLCESSGLLKVIEAFGATPYFFEEQGFNSYIKVKPSTSQHHWKDSMYIADIINDVDHIIYLPRVGSHIMGDISCGMKIAVGFLRDDSRLKLHQGGKNFYAMYEEINEVSQIKSKLRLIVSSGREVISTVGPDYGYTSKPDFGLICASSDILANELLAYSWLEWNRKHKTPYGDKIIGNLRSRFRSIFNRLLVIVYFYGVRGKKYFTPVMPVYQPGNIYNHPSIANFIKRKGGKPESIQWVTVNENPDSSIVQYMSKLL